MSFVANPPVLVDQTNLEILTVTDLRLTPGGGFQVVWDGQDGFTGTVLHHASYRLFDANGQPLTDEIADGSYSGGPETPVHLRRSIELDDGTILKVEDAPSNSPLSVDVLRLYDRTGVPLGDPIYTISGARNIGIAQLPNRDIVLVSDSATKTGVYTIAARVLDNTSPDLYAPQLTRIAGPDGAAQVPVDGTIVVNFNELIALASSPRIDLKTVDGALVDSFDVSDGADLSTWVSSLTIRPSASLDPGTGYVLQFAPGSVLDPSGNAFAGGSFDFTTAGDPPPPPGGDSTAPTAIDFFPANGSHLLPPDWSLGITFSETVQAGFGTITLQTAAGEVVQTFGTGDPALHFFGTSVVIDPAADLLAGTTYRLTVSPGAFEDLAGNAYGGVSDYSFTTAGSAPPPPPAGPVLVYSYPDNGKIMFDHNLGLVFNEPVKLGSGVITLETTAGEVVQAFPTFGPDGFSSGTRLFIDPTADLQIGTSYRLVIGPGAVVDLDGNPYPGTTTQPFTAATTSAIHVVSMDPAPRSNTLPPDGNLSITFDGAVKAGSGVFSLQSTQGNLQFVTATDPGVQFIGSTLVIDPAFDLQPGTEYHAVFGTDAVEDLAGNFVGVPDFRFTTAFDTV